MGGAGFILAINLAVAALLAGAFLLVSLYQKSHDVSARWFALAYATAMLNVAAEAAIPFTDNYRPMLTVAFATFLAAMFIFNIGLARMYAVRAPWRLLAVVFVASVALQMLTQGMPRDSFLRMTLYQSPYFLMQAISVGIIVAAPVKRRLDVGLMVLLAASALHFLAKPVLATLNGGMGPSPKAYLTTSYALFSQSLGTVFAMAVALMVFVILLRGVIADMTEKTLVDPLSGVLNRNGFKERLDAILSASPASGPPVSLIICDLDRFKQVNDTYGHACGDLVIAAFSRVLQAAAQEDYAVGRIGGEEFAVVLPGCNLASARLFAESVRTAFAGLDVEGTPENLRFTASFGVAELRGGETVSEALGRADKALYQAKAAGRDCVRVASSLSLETGPDQPLERRANRDA